MLGMKDEVLVDELGVFIAGLFAEQHVQEVGGVAEVGIGVEDFLALTDAPVGRNYCRSLCGESQALAERRLSGVVFGVRVVGRQRRDRGPEHVHRMRVARQPNDVENLCGKDSGRFQLRVKGVELSLSGELAIHHQVGGLLEVGLLCEIVNVVSTVQ